MVISSMFFTETAHAKTYKIGDIGPRGGVVFYVLDPETQSLWHYMEVSPNNWNQGKTSRLSFLNAGKRAYGYDNETWYIPAQEDMENIYKHRNILKRISFLSGKYWTSTGKYTFRDMSVIDMRTGKVSIDRGDGMYMVRPVRYF